MVLPGDLHARLADLLSVFPWPPAAEGDCSCIATPCSAILIRCSGVSTTARHCRSTLTAARFRVQLPRSIPPPLGCSLVEPFRPLSRRAATVTPSAVLHGEPPPFPWSTRSSPSSQSCLLLRCGEEELNKNACRSPPPPTDKEEEGERGERG